MSAMDDKEIDAFMRLLMKKPTRSLEPVKNEYLKEIAAHYSAMETQLSLANSGLEDMRNAKDSTYEELQKALKRMHEAEADNSIIGTAILEALKIIADDRADELTQLRAEHQAALARIAALEGEKEWKPIETAPKDGNDIILFIPSERWCRVHSGRFTDDAWRLSINNRLGRFNPTHWQPLPLPPQPTSHGEGVEKI